MSFQIDTVEGVFDSLRSGEIFQGLNCEKWVEYSFLYTGGDGVSVPIAVHPRELIVRWSHLLTGPQIRQLTEPTCGGVLLSHEWGCSIFLAE